MIAYLSGTLAEKKPTAAVIEVQGVGYALSIPASSFETLPAVGQPAKLFTYHYVREDAILLFGFATTAERALFETLLSVSGIGPKLALAALSAMHPTELRDRIIDGETGLLSKIPGVGKKTAERMVVELRDRVARLDMGPSAGGTGSEARSAARSDALAALESLGLSRASAERKLRIVLRQHPEIQTAEELIRLALNEN